ncbi:hypothetical protein RHGRI_001487 [Rhododendron griersonianum]|uniref:Uncharacterized protein n=1 Tax=Rhododendron griersonianum TaxID=479676 RepID=A0AAV6LP69_9ERIC|nr:hypothetical protein RHGRI_001487 [Rhododendron griersonianum]
MRSGGAGDQLTIHLEWMATKARFNVPKLNTESNSRDYSIFGFFFLFSFYWIWGNSGFFHGSWL